LGTSFSPQGGVKPYQAYLYSGNLPKGIEFYLSEAGLVLYGTPTQPNDNFFVIRWQDSSEFPIVMEAPIHLRVTGEDLQVRVEGSHPTMALIGNPYSFHYTLQNNTNLAVPQSLLVILMPDHLDNILISGDLTCIQEEPQILTCNILNFAGHSQQVVEITGTVRGPMGENINTQAWIHTVTDGWPELNPDDNQASMQVTTLIK